MSVTATGAGLLSLTGDGVGVVSATAAGAGLLSLTGAATATVAPAAIGAGTLSLSGAGVGISVVRFTGDGTLSLSGAGTAAVGAVAVGAGLLSLIGEGGDTARGVGAGTLSLSGEATAWVGSAASGRWLYLHTVPPAQVYATDSIRGRLSPSLPMHRARFDVTATNAQTGQQNDSFSVALSGIGSALRERLATQAPYGVRLDIMDGGDLSRSGIVSQFSIGADGALDLDCEADGWTDDLPLRTNADLGTFRDVEPLPWRYGRAVPGRCVRLGSSGKLWLWADHASERVTSVQVDGQDYGAWAWRNDVDAAGNPITIITTADAIDEGAELVATGDGMRDGLNGSLIVNPADMVFDLCRRASKPVDRGDLVPFRAECLARGIEVSGSISSGTLQQSMVSLADSIYAVFARDLPGLLRLLPRSGATVTIAAKDTPTARADRAGIATRLRVRYALEDNQPRGSLEMRAAGVETMRGISSADVVLPWVRDARVAADVAGRMLADRARVAYVITAATQRKRINPGDVVNVSVPRLGLSGAALVTASRIDEDGSAPTMLLRIGMAPAVTIAAQASAYTPDQYTGATVTTTGDLRQITITGTDGRPIVGARCTLNGSIVRTSDSAGRVSYPASAMPPGTHTILIEQAGMNPLTLTVVVP